MKQTLSLLKVTFTVFVCCFLVVCTPEFNNPYDPENSNPKPLAPSRISCSSPERGTVHIKFQYEYKGNSKVKIKRNDLTIAILKSRHELLDFWTFAEDTSMLYKFYGINEFSSTMAPKHYFYFTIPPRVKILTGNQDTIKENSVFLSGTVWDSSDIDIFMVNGDTIPLSGSLSNELIYPWDYTMTLVPGDNQVKIYAKDDSPFDSDTSIQFTIYHPSGILTKQ